MKQLVFALGALSLAACATTPVYGPASKEGAMGYTSQQIEAGRHRIAYTDKDPGKARSLALLRASEITLMEGRDWFEITSEYVDVEAQRGGGSSIGISGGTGTYGRSSSVGVGVGFGIPLGGGGSSEGKATAVLEIVTGANPKPERTTVYDARSVDMNLRGQFQ